MAKWMGLDGKQRVKGVPDCEECGGVGIIPPGMRAVRICGCRAYTQDLEGACKAIADKICRINPDYRSKMDALISEKHWDYTHVVGACIEFVYERGLQMTTPKAAFFSESTPETPTIGRCALESCGKEFTAKFQGDKFCSQECGVLALPKRRVAIVQPEPGPELESEAQPLPTYQDEHDQIADA